MYSHAEQGFVSCLGGAFLSHSGCLYILSSIYSHASGLEQIWSILLSLALPFRWRPRGCSLLSALSPALLLSLPGFPDLSLGTCAGERDVPGSGIPQFLLLRGQARSLSVSICLASHHDLLGFFFSIKNKFGFWFIYKSWVFPSPGTPKTSKAFSFSICL